jgi:ribosome production factor 2
MFACGTHQKKRPDNLIFGRMFAEHILDMFEFGVSEYVPVSQFNTKDMSTHIKPILLFQGEQFDFSLKHMRFKNFLIDFFKITDYEEANISELKRVMVFSSITEKFVTFKQYEINAEAQINVTDVKNHTLRMNEVGPRFTLGWRRDKIASDELFKEACKQPRLRNPELHKARKNQYTNEFGEKMGKVFL